MGKIKKAGIITGAVVGGVIGGAVSLTGKLAKNKTIDQIGSSIMDSTIYTGTIAGEVISGTADVVSGKIAKDNIKVRHGKDDVKAGCGKMVGNVVGNVKLVAENGGEIIKGARHMDKKRVVKGAKSLAKVVAVGMMTVGAIKISNDEEDIIGEDVESQWDGDTSEMPEGKMQQSPYAGDVRGDSMGIGDDLALDDEDLENIGDTAGNGAGDFEDSDMSEDQLAEDEEDFETDYTC